MGTMIKITLGLPLRIEKKEKWYVASCPALDVFSQGTSREDAKENQGEALQLFLGSCIERGTLDEVLKDCGFAPGAPDTISYTESEKEEHIDIPLYLLAQFRDENRCRA